MPASPRYRGFYIASLLFALRRAWRLAVVAGLCLGANSWGDEPAGLPPAAPRAVDFVKDIQPIFQTHCYACHGPKQQESSYRLDHKETALKGGELGPAIVPGKAGESPLLKYVGGLDKDVRMPPEGDRLSAEQVGLLRAWVEQGATWPESASVQLRDPRSHWAFLPPVRPELPDVKNKAWARAPIDRFILARLEQENLAPAAEADKTTLLRRLYLDLLGLPPSPRQVDAFLADPSAGAYEKQVEALLQSPHYGERWGRHWLDAARYADSDGYEKDKSRQIWFYRDWVVSAFNRDLPYDQFLIEQLAGDLLPGATQDQIVATGFLRNSMVNEEGGVDPEQFRMDAMFDRLDAVGKSMLGLTIQCCQCHTHKFDPISHEEYYRLFAFLNNDHEAQRVVYTAGEQQKLADLTRQMRELEASLQQAAPDWQARMNKWEAALKAPANWTALQAANAGDNGQRYIPQVDNSILAQGYAPTKFETHLLAPSPLKTIRAFRLELLNDHNLPASGPGRSFMGTCALTQFRVEAPDPKDPAKKATPKFKQALADYGNPDRPLEPNFYDKSDKVRITGGVAYAIDDKDETAWGIDQGPGRRNQPRVAIFVPEQPVELATGAELHIYLRQMHGGWNSDDNMNNNLGRFRLSVTDAPDFSPEVETLPPRVREILNTPREQRSPAQIAALFSYWRTTAPEWKETNDKLENLWGEWPMGATTLSLFAREQSRETKMLTRGDWLKPTKPVAAGTPKFLHPLADPQAPPNRLTFARWVADRRSPTTARVFVNRVWQAYFGAGLVTTPEDFGMQSAPPSHPALLDWLACEFMDRGWSVKELHRQIVHSAAYRQVSTCTPAAREKDPLNRLLARGPRWRVEGEVVRDIALSASGLLNPQVGGASVFAPAPAFLFLPPASYGPFTWLDATGEARYRRALYTFRRRSTPYPMLANFDTPNGDFSCVRRSRSNTPLQALTTLNEPVFLECARALALRAIQEGGGSDQERLTHAFRLCTARPPDAAELGELQALLAKQRQRIADGWLDAAELATGKREPITKLPAGVTPAQWASYTVVARVLLNLDETITKE